MSIENPYPEFIDDECTDQKFVNPQWQAFNRTIKAVYNWGNEPDPHDKERYLRRTKRQCNECWQELKV